MRYLDYIRPITAKEMIQTWLDAEKNSRELVEFAQAHNHTIETFRARVIDGLELRRRSWHEFRTAGLEFLERLKLGYPGWLAVANKNKVPSDKLTFGELAKHASAWGLAHNRIPDIMQNPPNEAQFVGLDFSGSDPQSDTDEPNTYLLEGSHRVFSFLLAKALGRGIDLSRRDFRVVLSFCEPDEEKAIVALLKQPREPKS